MPNGTYSDINQVARATISALAAIIDCLEDRGLATSEQFSSVFLQQASVYGAAGKVESEVFLVEMASVIRDPNRTAAKALLSAKPAGQG